MRTPQPLRKADVSLQFCLRKNVPSVALTVSKTCKNIFKPYQADMALIGSRLAHTDLLNNKEKDLLAEMFRAFSREHNLLKR